MWLSIVEQRKFWEQIDCYLLWKKLKSLDKASLFIWYTGTYVLFVVLYQKTQTFSILVIILFKPAKITDRPTKIEKFLYMVPYICFIRTEKTNVFVNIFFLKNLFLEKKPWLYSRRIYNSNTVNRMFVEPLRLSNYKNVEVIFLKK